MRLALKIILYPIVLLLSILIAFLKFIIKVSGMILWIISFLVLIGTVACFVQKDITTRNGSIASSILNQPLLDT